MAKLLLSLLLLTFFFPTTSPLFPTDSVLDAADKLTQLGYLSMSLTLQLVARDDLISSSSSSSSITIFAPPDTAFITLGQPSLHLLQYHFSPQTINLSSLSLADKIPTLYQNHSLTVTSNRSLNNVIVNNTVIYNLGSVTVYAIDTFFNPNFELPPPVDTVPIESHYLTCAARYSDYTEIAQALEIQNYAVIGSFLDLQLLGNGNKTKMTIFAPDDDALNDESVNFRDYAEIFRGHVVPCKLTWDELLDLDEDTVFPTFLKGFSVTVSRNGLKMSVNGVPVLFEEVWASENVVVHGIQRLISLPGITNGEVDSVVPASKDRAAPVEFSAAVDECVVDFRVLMLLMSWVPCVLIAALM